MYAETAGQKINKLPDKFGEQAEFDKFFNKEIHMNYKSHFRHARG